MDLKKLRRNAFFIPTPGQTEQEYLAQILSEKKICYFQKQHEFDFEKGKESKKYSGFIESKTSSTDWKNYFPFSNINENVDPTPNVLLTFIV